MKKSIIFLLVILLSNGWLFANHWIPDDSNFEDNMTLTGIIQINGVEQQSTTLEVGVFCGEECRGSGIPTYFIPTQRYVVQLTIFGELGNQLTFKLFDHALGQELDLVSPEAVSFNANGYGSLSDPYILNFTGSVTEMFAITAIADPTEGGTIGGTGLYEEGQTCTLVASPNENYAFVNWTEEGVEVSTNNTYSFTVDADRALTAHFISSETHWIPNGAQYEDNMTLTGVIQINGEEQQSTTLEVGVFCGEECRGSGIPTFFIPTQRYIVQLTIFGELGDQLTFKLFDHALGQELELVSPEAVSFIANGYGSLSDPYILNFTGSVVERFAITAIADPTEGGTIMGTGLYEEGQSCTLVATANENYAFVNWTEEGVEVSTNDTYSFTVDADRALTAHFTSSETHWIPNDAMYEDNMTLTGVIQINGVEQQSTTLEVGVFCGEECRGAQLATYFFPTQRYLVQLIVFGETGDQLTFKLFDHAIGQELNLTSPDAVAFVANGYGTLGNPYVLNFTGDIPTPVFHFITAGNWSNAANWQGGALPGANDAVFIDAPCQLDQNATVAALTVSNGQSLTLQPDKTLTVTGNLTNTSTEGLVIKNGAQLINASGIVAATMEKVIASYSNSNPDAWYTIASPMNEMPIEGSSFATPEFDLYRFNENNLTNEEWENYKGGLADFTTFENGRGYLFANSNAFSPAFTGTLNASSVTYPLSYTERSDDPLSGFHLIGNPFPHDIYKGVGAAINDANLASGYYTLTNEGTWQVHTFEDAIHPGQGILVKATAPTVLTIAKSTAVATSETGGAKRETSPLSISVKGENGMDQAFVYFGRGNSMEKMGGFVAQEPSLWVRDNGKDYAIAHVEKACETLELCFSSKQTGDFALTVDRNEKEFEYLQLVDHVTGLTVDLLKQPAYVFQAAGQEPEARFSIRFKVVE